MLWTSTDATLCAKAYEGWEWDCSRQLALN